MNEVFCAMFGPLEDRQDSAISLFSVMSGRSRTGTGSHNDSLYSASVPVNIGMGSHWEPMRRSDNLVDSSDGEDDVCCVFPLYF